MSYITPIPVGQGLFTSLASGDQAGWIPVPAGAPTPILSLGTMPVQVGTISISVGSPTITVSITINGQTATLLLANTSTAVYFLYLGATNGVLVLGQGKTAGSPPVSNFVEVHLYRFLTNDTIQVLSPTTLVLGTFPGVASSQGTTGNTFLIPFLSGSMFILWSTVGATTLPPPEGFLYRSDNGQVVGNSFPQLSGSTNFLAFCASTTISTVSPPSAIVNGIQLFRGATPTGGGLIPGSWPVPAILPANDVYVRDWNASPSSFDPGAQPDSPPAGQNWFTDGDVWNMNTLGPGTPDATTGSYPNQDPIAGQMNYAYSRISRVAAGVATQVTAEYLTAPFGTGNNFASIGQETISFPAGSTMPQLGGGFAWTAPATASPHYCMAVEIQTDYDPLMSDLDLSQPGPADSQILAENNKAQRNMAVVLMGGGGPTPTPKRLHLTHYAVIHNSFLLARDMVLRYEAAPEVLRHMPNMRIEIVGGDSVPFHQGGRLTLHDMQPGENRTIGLILESPPVTEGRMLTVQFTEMAGDVAVNGFAIAVQSAPLARVIQANMAFERSVGVRVAAIFKGAQARKEQDVPKTLDRGAYEAFLQKQPGPMKEAMQHILKEGQPADSFGLAAAHKSLEAAIGEKDAGAMAVAHAALLHKLDASLTMLLLSRGNPADILQNVRWQDFLYTTLPQLKKLDCAPQVREASQQFIQSSRQRKTDGFAKLLRGLAPCFRATAGASPAHHSELEKLVAQIEAGKDDLAALQKAHRDYLLRLQVLFKS